MTKCIHCGEETGIELFAICKKCVKKTLESMKAPRWFLFKCMVECWFHYLFVPWSTMHAMMVITRQKDMHLWFLHGYIECELEEREGHKIDFQQYRED